MTALEQFLAAPEPVQAAFFRQLGEEIDRERELDEWLRDQIAFDMSVAWPAPPAHRTQTQWDERWRRRAERVAAYGLDPELRLLEIDASDYVLRLTGEECQPGRAIRCPLPGHDERSASFQVYGDGGGWYCFGCSRGGNIFNLAGHLWNLDPRGPAFPEIRERLEEVFG